MVHAVELLIEMLAERMTEDLSCMPTVY